MEDHLTSSNMQNGDIPYLHPVTVMEFSKIGKRLNLTHTYYGEALKIVSERKAKGGHVSINLMLCF